MNSILYGNNTISYALLRADRKTLAITVEPDMSVIVKAPLQAEDDAITRIVRKRAAWILRQQRYFTQFLPRTPARQYIGGETHLYLGRQYRLRIRILESRTDSEPAINNQQPVSPSHECVKLIGGYLYVYVQEPAATGRIQELLHQWYGEHAQIRLRERLEVCMQQVRGWDIPSPPLNIRRLKNRWGICSPDGTLTLNLDLIRAPRACIDYVILHEICHLRHPNHAPEFYKLLAHLLPDWQDRKQRLERLLS